MALTAGSTFVDGFPADPSEPDYAVQSIIDGELRNCQALAGTRALPGLLYPAYFAAGRDVRAAWLEPALRRFAWNSGRQPWNDYLHGLLWLLVSSSSPPGSDEVMLLLAQLGPQLQSNSGRDCQIGEAIAAGLKNRKAPLPPELIEALRTLVNHLIGVHSHGNSTFHIAWRLWRAPENPDDGGSCFSARVRADLRAMQESEAASWSALLELRSASLDDTCAATLRDRVRRIGRDRFAARWKSWIGWLDANQPATLSPVGRDLLILFLHACRADSSLALDDSLYQLCGVRWAGTGNHLLTKEWLGALLVTLATRPAQPAFACAERLLHNPDTGTYVDVHKLYNQLLAEVAGDADQPRQREGVDGYDLMSEPELYREQVILDCALRETPPGSSRRPGVVHTAWGAEGMVPLLIRRQAETDHANFVRAAASRARWLQQISKPPEIVKHKTPFGEIEARRMDPCLHWRVGIDQIQRVLLKAGPALGHDDLVALIETDTSASAGGSTSPLISQVAAYTKDYGYSLPLVEAMGRWHATQRGSYGALDMRHRIGWLLWLEDVAPIREKDCWSQRIRKDLRQMPPASRTAWRTILENTSLAKSRKPAKPWEKRGKAALARLSQEVSADEFRRRVRGWFEPFRAEEPLHLTVCGRDVLRNLMWYALLANDPQVDEAIAWFASAEWRSKRDQSCSETVLPAFVYVMLERSDELAYSAIETYQRKGKAQLRGKLLQSYQELCTRLGRTPSVQAPPEPAAAPSNGVIPMVLKRFASSRKVRLENDRLVVTGARETYEIDPQDSRIVRRSDGRPVRLELDASQPGFSMLRSMLDHQDLTNPFGPNYLRLVMYTRLLMHDDINAGSIVAESVSE